MSFRKLAAVLLAGGLALTACGQQSNLGSSAPSAPPVASGASFPEGSTITLASNTWFHRNSWSPRSGKRSPRGAIRIF